VKILAILVGTICCLSCQVGDAQPKTTPQPRVSKPSPATASKGPGNSKQASSGLESQGKANDLFGGDDKNRPKGPTDIRCTEEAQFDVKTRSGVFIGNVKVVDPQFTLTSDRLAVKLNKDEEGGGLNEAQADGNVMIVHVNQPKNSGVQPQGQGGVGTGAQQGAQAQQPITSTGKAARAVYEAKDGSVTLTGWPQVTQGVNTHIATAPGVKMILYRDGRMQTFGSTRTLIQDRTATNQPNANGAQ
jgi:lipopolysaccharide export system protein LptA